MQQKYALTDNTKNFAYMQTTLVYEMNQTATRAISQDGCDAIISIVLNNPELSDYVESVSGLTHDSSALPFYQALIYSLLANEFFYNIAINTMINQYVFLTQIIALITFNRIDGVVVNAGDLGGWVASTSNLGQEGVCWIADNAACFDTGYQIPPTYSPCVWDDALIMGNAQVRDHANLTAKAIVQDNAILQDRSVGSGIGHAYDNVIFKETSTLVGIAKGDTVYSNSDVAW